MSVVARIREEPPNWIPWLQWLPTRVFQRPFIPWTVARLSIRLARRAEELRACSAKMYCAGQWVAEIAASASLSCFATSTGSPTWNPLIGDEWFGCSRRCHASRLCSYCDRASAHRILRARTDRPECRALFALRPPIPECASAAA